MVVLTLVGADSQWFLVGLCLFTMVVPSCGVEISWSWFTVLGAVWCLFAMVGSACTVDSTCLLWLVLIVVLKLFGDDSY